ncbi:MAG TPA: serine/threonine-protein kinase, partial [Kofleriaceae bacterium]|nr:serine/threonine-protein kinase [Kofleriaceae bacterium]
MQACLDDARVHAFVGKTLGADARREVEDHVDECAHCRRLLVALVRDEPERRRRWHAGERIGRYEIGASVGRGAMGEVFRGRDTELARPVALKRLHAGTNRDVRLAREARAAAQLQHPNVIAVYEIVTDGDDAVLACEWVEGVTLREWLAAERRPLREVLHVVGGAGRGLAAAHAAGIVHRDFKPENVLVDHTGRARVADFGLASAFEAAEGTQPVGVTPLRLTITGTLAGTPAYMAPELVDGARPDAASDQFAFAVTLFEAVYGTYPFAGRTPEAVWAAMAASTFVKCERRVPPWLERALRRALAPEPGDRFPTIAALLDLIDQRARRGMGIPLAGAGAVGGIVVAALLAALPSDATPACGEDLVDEVWSPSVRESYVRQFARVGAERSAPTITFTEQALEQWRGAWRLGRRAACAAEPSERRARMMCLDRQLGDLRAQLAVWQRADAAVVDRAITATTQLPSPTACTSAVENT